MLYNYKNRLVSKQIVINLGIQKNYFLYKKNILLFIYHIVEIYKKVYKNNYNSKKTTKIFILYIY